MIANELIYKRQEDDIEDVPNNIVLINKNIINLCPENIIIGCRYRYRSFYVDRYEESSFNENEAVNTVDSENVTRELITLQSQVNGINEKV